MTLMPAIPPRLSGLWRDRLLPVLPVVALALVVFAGGLPVAETAWRLARPAEPPAVPAAETDPRHLAQRLSALRLFGGDRVDAAPATAASTPQLRLAGVAAGTGIALIAIAGGPAEPYRQGEEVVAGLRLGAVSSRGVTLEAAGHRETLLLPESR
jgi:hypothetical protein